MRTLELSCSRQWGVDSLNRGWHSPPRMTINATPQWSGSPPDHVPESRQSRLVCSCFIKGSSNLHSVHYTVNLGLCSDLEGVSTLDRGRCEASSVTSDDRPCQTPCGIWYQRPERREERRKQTQEIGNSSWFMNRSLSLSPRAFPSSLATQRVPVTKGTKKSRDEHLVRSFPTGQRLEEEGVFQVALESRVSRQWSVTQPDDEVVQFHHVILSNSTTGPKLLAIPCSIARSQMVRSRRHYCTDCMASPPRSGDPSVIL